MWLDLLKSILAPLVAFLYSILVAHYPDFPLQSKDILALLLWLIGLWYSGAKAKTFHLKRKNKI